METQLADRAFNFFIMQPNETHKHTFALFDSTQSAFFLNTEKVFSTDLEMIRGAKCCFSLLKKMKSVSVPHMQRLFTA